MARPAVDIYLVRTSLTTAEGFLSHEGRRIVRELATRIALNEEPAFDRVMTGPAPAAVQTAELFADRASFLGVVEVEAALAAGVPAEVLAPRILASGSVVAAVGDEPWLSALGAFLVGRPTFPPLVPAQVSVIRDRRPLHCFRPGEIGRSQLLVA